MKIVNITYGLKGENPKKYSYLVNDNIRTGQVIFPSVKHYESGKIFGTVGVVQNAYKESGKNAQDIKEDLEAQGKTLDGTIAEGKGINQMGSISQTKKNEDGLRVGTEKTINNYESQKKDNPYIQERKQTAVRQRVEADYQTADEYASQFEFEERGGR